MALRPWTPEREVDAGLARALVEEQFPQFKPARVEPLGEGWDNAVFKANDKWVFRFPRRQLAAPARHLLAARHRPGRRQRRAYPSLLQR